MRNARQSDIERGLGMWTTRKKQTGDREISRCSAVRTTRHDTTRHPVSTRQIVQLNSVANKQMRNDSKSWS